MVSCRVIVHALIAVFVDRARGCSSSLDYALIVCVCGRCSYDRLNQLLWANYGKFDFETARDVITFLSPDRTPGYWHDYLIPGNNMSAQVQGVICVADLQQTVFASKGGYWSDGWLQIQLSKYVS